MKCFVFVLAFDSGKQLLWVAGLGVAVLFIYGVIAFASLNRSFTQEDDLFCDNVFECFVSVIRTGLIDNVFVRNMLLVSYYGDIFLSIEHSCEG